MINPEDVLSLEFLKKADCYTGCREGLRYRLRKMQKEDGTVLQAAAWPEPFNFFKTPEEEKSYQEFAFSEDGIADAVRWLNQKLFELKEAKR